MPVLTAPIAGILSDRIGARRIVAFGLLLQTIGIAWLAAVSAVNVPYSHLVPAFVLAGAGMGLFFAPIARMTIDFAPTSLQDLTDPDSREEVAPEDMPVKTRQQPGYEPVGIRADSWMFTPALISGGFYDSNVFSSNTIKKSDLAAVVEPTLTVFMGAILGWLILSMLGPLYDTISKLKI